MSRLVALERNGGAKDPSKAVIMHSASRDM
jgi:hypothetical protein